MLEDLFIYDTLSCYLHFWENKLFFLAFLRKLITGKIIINKIHYNDVIMSALASQITSLTIVYSTVYSRHRAKKKNQTSASLAFVRRIPGWPVNSPHKGPVARKMFPFDDVIMWTEAVGLCVCNTTLYFRDTIHPDVSGLGPFSRRGN